jgi:hypothetical protein
MQNSLKSLIDSHRIFYYRHIYFEFKLEESLNMMFNDPALDKFDIRDIF